MGEIVTPIFDFVSERLGFDQTHLKLKQNGGFSRDVRIKCGIEQRTVEHGSTKKFLFLFNLIGKSAMFISLIDQNSIKISHMLVLYFFSPYEKKKKTKLN